MTNHQQLDLETLIALAEQLAAQHEGGHLTLLRFTTGWKCGLGTPDLDSSNGRVEVADMPAFPTLRDALTHLITHRQHVPSAATSRTT